ncbi:MAG: hypothetical protein KTR21_11310 [Rhodobacteraceae bacterium]|nr:hypothetical protein [Paracoccaceae bacterium]
MLRTFLRLVVQPQRLGALAIAVATLTSGGAWASNICSAANVNAVLENGQRSNKIDKRLFYENIKASFPVFDKGGNHYIGTDAILDYWNRNPKLKDNRWLAYLMGTTLHETANRMFPVRETLASSDEIALQRLRRFLPGKTYYERWDETGQYYYGRGYVQLTWHYNYKKADERLGITDREKSFYWNADLALDPQASLDIIYDGMLYGWFTRRCLLEYFRPNVQGDWLNARRVINGKDRAADIAKLSQKFLTAIKAAEVPASFAETVEAQQNSSVGQDIEGLRTENTKVLKQVDDLRTEMLAQIEALRADMNRERTRFETLTLSNERLASDIAGARTELGASRQQVQDSMAELAATRADIDATRQQLSQTQTEIEATRTDISDTRGDITLLRGEIDDVRAELAALPRQLELSVEDQQRLIAMESSLASSEAALRAAEGDRRLNRDGVQAVERQMDALAEQLNQQNRQLNLMTQALQQANNRTLWNYMFGGSGE